MTNEEKLLAILNGEQEAQTEIGKHLVEKIRVSRESLQQKSDRLKELQTEILQTHAVAQAYLRDLMEIEGLNNDVPK